MQGDLHTEHPQADILYGPQATAFFLVSDYPFGSNRLVVVGRGLDDLS